MSPRAWHITRGSDIAPAPIPEFSPVGLGRVLIEACLRSLTRLRMDVEGGRHFVGCSGAIEAIPPEVEPTALAKRLRPGGAGSAHSPSNGSASSTAEPRPPRTIRRHDARPRSDRTAYLPSTASKGRQNPAPAGGYNGG